MFDRKLNQERLVVGLGGNAGSGKTTVAAELKRLGAQVIDADAIASVLLRRSSPEYKKLVKAFGPDILNKSGQVERKALAAKAFATSATLKKLNAITHPPILAAIRKEMAERKRGLVILDAPLLFAVGLNKEVDIAVLVTAPDRLKLKRLVDDGLSREEAKRRLEMQEPDSKVWRKADFVLENKGSMAEMRRKTRALWNFFYSTRFQNLLETRK